MTWAAVILAGGTGSRLGGADKAQLVHGGRSLLDRALAAVSEASEVVVVGDPVPTYLGVRFAREDPVGAGPLAAVRAGVDALESEPDVVAVLAVDMPGVTEATVQRLRDAAALHEGAWLTDRTGRRQLAGVVRRALVLEIEEVTGRPMRLLLEADGTVGVPARAGEADDVDTWDDLARRQGRGSSADVSGTI